MSGRLIRTNGDSVFVRAFDHTGHNQPWHLIKVGDRIEWKREGFTGYAIARVEAINTERSKLQIIPVDVDGEPRAGARRRSIGVGPVARIYDPETGKRRPPATPQELGPV